MAIAELGKQFRELADLLRKNTHNLERFEFGRLRFDSCADAAATAHATASSVAQTLEFYASSIADGALLEPKPCIPTVGIVAAALDHFDNVWLDLEDVGKCDGIGGQQYRRIRSEWIAVGAPSQNLEQFIEERAN